MNYHLHLDYVSSESDEYYEDYRKTKLLNQLLSLGREYGSLGNTPCSKPKLKFGFMKEVKE